MPYFQSSSRKIHYKVEGSGMPLLCLMGLGADGETWRLHVNEYKKHFTCILVDNQGAGLSDAPEPTLTTADMARDAIGILDELHISKAHVAGISMGGAIAQEVALLRPSLVDRLLLISTWDKLDAYGKKVFDMLADAYAALPGDKFTRLLQLWIFSPWYFENQVEDLELRVAAVNPHPFTPQAFAAQCHACSTHDTSERLSAITCHTLITVGSADIFTPIQYAQALEKGIQNSRLEVFESLAHTHHWEDLNRFNALSTQFLLDKS
jgi:pimeloyl-ACP methyl ester carboxylesterase